MPFVGETGGSGHPATGGRRPTRPAVDADRSRPDRAGLRPTRASPSAWPRPAGGERRRAPGPRRRPRARARPDAAMTGAARAPAVGGTRDVPAPTRSPATTCCSASASTSTSRAWSTATSGRPTSRPRSTWSNFGRRRGSPTTPRRSAAASRRGRRTRPARLARRPARRPRDAGRGPGRRGRCRTSTTSRAASRSAAAPPRRPIRGRRGRARRAPPRRWAARRATGRLGPALRGPGRSRPASSTGSSERRARPRNFRPAGRRGPRGQLVTGQPWTGYNWYDGGRRSRVDFNTDLPVRAARISSASPTRRTRPPPRARLEGGDLVDRHGRLESSILLINTPECLISEGLADLGAVRRAARRARRPARRAVRPRGPRRSPRTALPRATAELCHALEGPRDWARSAGNAAILLTPTARHTTRSSPTWSTSAASADRLEAARVHRAPAVADVRLRLRRGRGPARRWLDAVPNGNGPPGSAGSSTSSSRRARSQLPAEGGPIVAVGVVVGVGEASRTGSACPDPLRE